MADKVNSGDAIPRSANLWNNIIGAADDYALRQLGQPGSRSPVMISGNVIKIKNSSGAAVRLGEVLEISGFLLTDVVRDSLWFDGDEPDGTRPFAIAMQDIPTTSIDRATVSGVCVALVQVADADHHYATVESGEPVLQSAEDGPVRILYKPSGTGEKTCAVLIAATGAATPLKPLCRFTLGEAMATSDASKTGTITHQYGHGSSHTTTTGVTFNNLLTSAAATYLFEGDSGDAGYAFYDPDTAEWYILQMECP